MSSQQRHRAAIVAAALAVVAVLALLAFGVFGIQSAFIDNEVDEANPFFVTEGASGLPSDDMTSDDVEKMNDFLASNPVDATRPADEAEPDMPEITTLAQGSFIDRIHAGAGTAVVLTDGTQTFLRFEDDFAIDNGPDLNVYLVADVDADGEAGRFDDDFIDLGDLTGNIGSQNYEIPADVDLGRYDTVVIWCVRFGVAFNAADLA